MNQTYSKPASVIQNGFFLGKTTQCVSSQHRCHTPGGLTRVSSCGSVAGRRPSFRHSVLSGVVQVGDDCGEVTVTTVGQGGKNDHQKAAVAKFTVCVLLTIETLHPDQQPLQKRTKHTGVLQAADLSTGSEACTL